MQPGPPAPASGEAVASLVCGVIAWTLTCFPLGFAALWLGARARRAARENPNAVGGEQLALVGMILGGVAGVLFTLVWIGYAALFFGMFAFGGLSSTP
jgi:hypothetical protein